jgi:hypothetical protein
VFPGAQTPWQAPLTQACAPHDTGTPHEAPGVQVCTAVLLEHWFAPGLQGPWHWALGAVPLHELLHANAADQVPSLPQVWTPLPWHCLALGAQTPVQLPIEQAYGQALGVLQLPVESHVWTALPEHWEVPGVHTPMHAPLEHAWLVHGVVVPQLPVASQVWTALPEHCVAPGVQTPVQVPIEQA